MTFLAAILIADSVALAGGVPAVAEPAATNDVPAVAEPVAGVPPAAESRTPATMPGSLEIRSDRADYDNKAGVAMFDGHVALDAVVRGEKYTMNAAQMYVFFEGTNDLKRVVAIGDVAVTNGLRTGSCAKATFAKSANRVTMYGGDDGTPAVLANADPRQKGDVTGRRIRFWLDSEQVEVEGSTVTLDTGRLEKDGRGRGLKGLFGK